MTQEHPMPPLAPRRFRSRALCGLFFTVILLSAGRLEAEDVQGLVLPFKLVSVSAPAMQDIIQEINVEEGDTVKEGTVLASLKREKEELDAQQYAKEVERREFQSKGMESLFKEKMVSKDSTLEKKTDLELSRIQHKLALERLDEKIIKAPISGIVVKKYKEAGEAVDRVEKLFDIINIDKLYIQLYVDPKTGAHLAVDAKAPLKFSMPAGGVREATGTVVFVEPRIDAGSGLIRVKLLLDNPNHEIKPGMRCGVDFAHLQATAAK